MNVKAINNAFMKLLFFTGILLSLYACGNPEGRNNSGQQTDLSSIVHAEDEKAPAKIGSVSDIQKEYAAVMLKHAKKSMDSAVYKYDCGGERSGTIVSFTEQGELKMIEHRYSEYSHFSATDQFFVKDSSLYFVFLDQVSWSFDSDAAQAGATKDNITEQRFYFVDQQPVKCLEKKFTVRSSAKDNPRSESVASKEVSCQSSEEVIKQYQNILDYLKKDSKKDCLEKS